MLKKRYSAEEIIHKGIVRLTCSEQQSRQSKVSQAAS